MYNKNMGKRVFVFILDGFGIGSAEDAMRFGDSGANTCQNVLRQNPHLEFPTLKSIGLLDVNPKNVLIEKNPNKDTLSGISEMFGRILPKLTQFEDDIPLSLVKQIESSIGTKTLWGKKASGTEIMSELGEEHLKNGYPILYTSQDSVLQLLAHEEKVPLSLLYYFCYCIRQVVEEKYVIGRIIARPFQGYTKDTFQRTRHRKDFVYKSTKNSFLDQLKKEGTEIFGNRILHDIFGSSLINFFPGKSNSDMFSALSNRIETNESEKNQLWIIDFEDFDMNFGHRRDPKGFGQALKEFDDFLGSFMKKIHQNDQIIITADHGNDPTYTKHTDHTRENVPLIHITANHETMFYGKCFGFHTVSEIIQQSFNA